MSHDDIADALQARQMSVAVAESLTGGLLSDAFAKMPEASQFFRGGLVAYAPGVKRSLLGIGDAHVVSREAATAMAESVATLLAADIGLAVTGVGGPDEQDGLAPGTVWMALHTRGETIAMLRTFSGDPPDVVRQACDAALDAVRTAVAAD